MDHVLEIAFAILFAALVRLIEFLMSALRFDNVSGTVRWMNGKPARNVRLVIIGYPGAVSSEQGRFSAKRQKGKPIQILVLDGLVPLQIENGASGQFSFVKEVSPDETVIELNVRNIASHAASAAFPLPSQIAEKRSRVRN